MINIPKPLISPDHRCGTCHRGPKETEFHRYSNTGNPYGECKDCRKTRNNLNRRETRDAMKEPPPEDGSIEKMMSITLQRTVKLPAVRQLACALLDKFDGVDGLADVTFHHIDLLLNKKPGTKAALDGLRFVYKLIATGLEEEKVSIDFGGMSEEELQTLVGRYLQRREALAGSE